MKQIKIEDYHIIHGVLRVYVRGEADFQSDVDWESGVEEGCFELRMDKISITKIEPIGEENEKF